MIEIKLLELSGFAAALQALHLPFGKAPHSFTEFEIYGTEPLRTTTCAALSEHDKDLLRRLVKSGDEHAKVTRGIVAYLEINAPRYIWQEFSTYRLGCEVLSSESTMHIQGKGLSQEELVRMKSELPEGTMQRRIVMLSYQTLRRIYNQRRLHRLPQWRDFCKWIETELPCPWLITA